MSETEMCVEDHKWFDSRCHFEGCRSLILEAALKRLSFAAQTTGGTAGRDDELVAAIAQAEAALSQQAPQVTPSGLTKGAGT
jgi:hypothetical protein